MLDSPWLHFFAVLVDFIIKCLLLFAVYHFAIKFW